MLSKREKKQNKNDNTTTTTTTDMVEQKLSYVWIIYMANAWKKKCTYLLLGGRTVRCDPMRYAKPKNCFITSFSICRRCRQSFSYSTLTK